MTGSYHCVQKRKEQRKERRLEANCQSHFLAVAVSPDNSVKDTNASNQVATEHRLLFLVPNSGRKALVRLIGKGGVQGASMVRPLYP